MWWVVVCSCFVFVFFLVGFLGWCVLVGSCVCGVVGGDVLWGVWLVVGGVGVGGCCGGGVGNVVAGAGVFGLGRGGLGVAFLVVGGWALFVWVDSCAGVWVGAGWLGGLHVFGLYLFPVFGLGLEWWWSAMLRGLWFVVVGAGVGG